MAKKAGRNHALAVVKAGLAAIPVVGGSIASLVGDYIPLSTQRAVVEAIELLKRKIGRLEGRLDTEAVDRDEFSELFKSCYLTIIRTHQREKLNAAAALIANLLLKEGDSDKLGYTELDHFVRCLDALSIGAIQALGHAVVITEAKGDEQLYASSLRFDFGRLHRTMSDMDAALVMGLVSELHSMNLVQLKSARVRTEDYHNYAIELTPLGVRFALKFLRDPA